jgi:transcriptional regulator GlxA family with amidase domain
MSIGIRSWIRQAPAMHRVAIVAMNGVVPADVAAPYEVFSRVKLPNGKPGYDTRVCGVTRAVEAGPFRLALRYGLEQLARADTVVLAGIDDVSSPIPPALVRAVQRAAARGARVASVCSGAFLLAATGLLDGRRATTHWLAADILAQRYPRIRVDPGVLYVDEGAILTSAGAAAALDLCLYMVRRDYGAAIAAEAARLCVMPLERSGGQSQFITQVAPSSHGSSLEPLMQWLELHLSEPLTLAKIARRAALSVRSLNRHFRAQTGTTPLQYLLRARVQRARQLLETTALPIEHVASEIGFGSVAAFRAHFRRVVATSPQAYRRAFRAGPVQRPSGARARAKPGKAARVEALVRKPARPLKRAG